MVGISRTYHPYSEPVTSSDHLSGYGLRPIDRASHEIRAKVAGLVLKYGKFIDIQEIDPTIQVDLKYATRDNFAGEPFYPHGMKALLRYEVAVMLHHAQKHLKEKMGDAYSLIVYDAGRPQPSHEKMYDWAIQNGKTDYFAGPMGGSIHSFGCAVDVSIIHEGKTLDMGTDFDALDEASGTDPEGEIRMLESGILTREQIEHRTLLRAVMKAGGLSGIDSEWWHFETSADADMRKRIRRDFERMK